MRTDVTDNYFGTEVPDPYRWLEDDNASEATAAWVKCPERRDAGLPRRRSRYRGRDPRPADRIVELPQVRRSAPKRGDACYLFLTTTACATRVGALPHRSGLGGQAGTLPRPQYAQRSGYRRPDRASPSPRTAATCAYSAAASAGSDWVEIRVMDTATGRTLTPDRDQLGQVFREPSVAPVPRGSITARYDAPQTGHSCSRRQNRVPEGLLPPPRHAPVDADRTGVQPIAQHPLRLSSAPVSRDKDGQWLFIAATGGYVSGTEVLYKKVSEPASAAPCPDVRTPARALCFQRNHARIRLQSCSYPVSHTTDALELRAVTARRCSTLNDGASNGRLLQAVTSPA